MKPLQKRIIWVKPLLVAIIIFPLSLLIDLVMSRELDYAYALFLAIIFGGVYFLLEFLLDYRSRKRRG
jgi:hypothetical protein